MNKAQNENCFVFFQKSKIYILSLLMSPGLMVISRKSRLVLGCRSAAGENWPSWLASFLHLAAARSTDNASYHARGRDLFISSGRATLAVVFAFLREDASQPGIQTQFVCACTCVCVVCCGEPTAAAILPLESLVHVVSSAFADVAAQHISTSLASRC